MSRTRLLLLICIGALVAFALYCAALINWIQDYSAGMYDRNYTRLMLETGAILIYTYLGIRFFNRNLRSFL
ncbi:hypothetical protein [Spirosoma endophyticum]|uniref:Uncharacterized protein n=1 Tax=Spirosoma endophyticum TaxID=662367 RepID=A0A1I1I7A9_9BACT|nr:hypothetical protein [Spirosoma endophyticum]SFC31702.1 hypothetical protein SAMN05216167_101859 [Spirosoma endophyticum]